MIGFDELGSKGWLGNQMFQYASLRGIASHKGYDFCIPPNDGTRNTNYLLHDIFTLAGAKNIGYVGGLYKHPTSDDICHSTTFHFNEEFFNECPDNVNISGFYQSEKWFKHIEEDVRSDFIFKDEILSLCESFIKEFDITPIFVHVRRGDFIDRPDHHYNLSMEYFVESISKFDKDIPVLVFSDDIKWCRDQEIFKPDRFNFSETSDRLPLNNFLRAQYTEGALIPYFDLCLMTLCNGGVISNSSFSWWGAWLQRNRTRDIICPTKNKWGGRLNTCDYSDIAAEGWVSL